jgi:hypothetical protein
MGSDGLCSDPADISLLVLKVFSSCLGGDLSFLFYAIRVLFGLILDGAEMLVLKTTVLKDLTEDNDNLDFGSNIAIALMFSISLIIVAVLGGMVLQSGLDEEEVQIRKNRFFIAFKTTNILFAIVIGAGTVYGRDELDFDKWEHIFLIVSLGLDVLFDPIELIIGCCVCCRND